MIIMERMIATIMVLIVVSIATKYIKNKKEND